MNFGERIGRVKPRLEIQVDSIDDPLKNSLWSVVIASVFDYKDIDRRGDWPTRVVTVTKRMFLDTFKIPLDRVPDSIDQCKKIMREIFVDLEWIGTYEFMEGLVEAYRALGFNSLADEVVRESNKFLERELSAYRFVGDQLAPITSTTEVEAVNQAILPRPQFAAVSEHIATAVSHYSNRTNPDYRNSIKESISAVEAAARAISGNERATLGQALNLIEKNRPIHPALKDGLSKIYGFTSDAGGIRHSLTDEGTAIDQIDAYFMLVSCSAFCNYLIERYSKVG